MLKRLFKSEPKWQSPKSQKRIEALAELDLSQEKDRGILLRLAREDSEPAVRREAVKYLSDLEVIAQIQKRDLEAPVRDAAAQRLLDLIAGAGALPLEQRLAGIRRLTTPSMLVHVVKEADHIDLKLAAIAQLNDEMFLDDIARHSTIARLRLAAAERIHTPALLEALAEASKQKDKNVYKAIRARLDASHQHEKETRALQDRRVALCEAMEHHARSAMNPLYTAKAESLRQQWQEAAGPDDAALGERFETAFALAWKQISELAAQAQREADIAQAREEMLQAVTTLEATFAEWQGQDDFDLPALAATRKTQRLRWEVATQVEAAAPALVDRYEKVAGLLDRLEQMLVQWQQDSLVVEGTVARLAFAEGEERDQNLAALEALLRNYRDYALPLPGPLQRLPRAVPAADAPAAPTRRDSAPEHQKALRDKLDKLAAAIKAGHTRDAGRLLRKAQDLARDHGLNDARLGELSAQLQELRSWAGFAVQPKKEDLVARMQALAGHDMDPDDKADAIHALQEEWKALGVADAVVEQPLWERFKAAGDAAFEPCREHFARQRELREQNLARREALVAQLDAYRASLDGRTDIDWKAHETILRTARQEWQQFHPSDRHKTRPLQDRFHEVLDALEQGLRAVQGEREARKRDLIARARALLEAGDLRAACDSAKQFQQEWKAIGPAHPRVDRKLWQEFRAACDTLFGRREAEFKARQAGRDATVETAAGLVAELEALAAAAATDARDRATALEKEFAALDLPREQAGALRKRLQAARARLEEAGREHRAGARRAQQDQVIREWESRASGDAGDKAGQLLLDLEILLELPSPESQRDARRARQMQRLQEKGLRRGNDEAGQLLAELLRTAPAQDAQLGERLRQVLQKTER
jgi:hypothetical protein